MPRTPKLPISKTPSGKWRYDLPPTMAESGRRQRKIFENKTQAQLSRQKDLERHNLYGVEGFSIPPSLATEAVKAREILEPTGCSLLEAVCSFVDRWEKANKSKTLAELWECREDELNGMSASHRSTNAALGRKILPVLGGKLVCDISHEEIREALSEAYPTAHGYNLALRNIKAAFKFAVTEGWVADTPCKRLKNRKTGNRKKVSILSLNQCRKLMASAIDYRKKGDGWPEYLKVDASGSMPALAIMLFAGVRPTETTRLEWKKDVNLEDASIFVEAAKAKTDRSRYIDMPDTLLAWLKTVPEAERIGSIVPLNWKKCWQAIRREVGIGDERDQLRKTFASCHLQAFNDVKATRSIMGHEVGDVLFTNYRGAVSKADATKFWNILPKGKQHQLRAVG